MAGRMPTPHEIDTKTRVRAFCRWLERQVPDEDFDAGLLIAVIEQAALDLSSPNTRHALRRFGAYQFFAGAGLAGAWCERYCNLLGLERLTVVATLMELGLWQEPERPKARARRDYVNATVDALCG